MLARRVGLFALALFLAAAVAHRLGSLAAPNFIAVAGVAVLIAVLGLLLGLVGIWRLWKVGAKGGWASFTALIAAAIVLVPVGYAAWLYVTRPDIHDVSSNVMNPPQWLVPPSADQEWLPRHTVSTTAASALQAEAYPQIVSRRYEGAMDRVLQAVKMAIRDENMKVVAETGTAGASPAVAPDRAPDSSTPDVDTPREVASGVIPVPLNRPSPLPIIPDDTPAAPRTVRIQAVHRSAVFGLTSDVVIRLTENAETTVVDMRVASRYGDNDLGSGAALIRSFFNSLDTDLL
ncbi:MAG TPA: DUF1499 domain-containing protein, partial [Pararhizobium sp.]|nr:DUF1499 domain-containing protein [Pararhizobium sp.]